MTFFKRIETMPAPAAIIACGLALALVVALFPITKAAAYYSFGTVDVSVGSSYLSLAAGSSTSTSVSVDPSSDSQTLGCGMAKCPQVCEDEGAVAAGYHCFDTNGQCTCAGSSYSTYYPEVSAQSSNSGVATATVSGGTLVVTGHAAGTATITVNASLRQWESNSTSVVVEVSAPAQSQDGAAGGSGTGSSVADGGTSAAPAADEASIPEAATVTDARDDALNETVIETVAGKVYLTQNNAYLDTAAQLNKIKGTSDQAVFWAGSSSDKPEYSWTFVGTDITDLSQNLSFDPTITVSKLGTGNVSNIAKQARDALVMEFAHTGVLPAAASLYVKASGAYADGTELGLYVYNADSGRFELAQTDKVKVSGGYATFKIDHCSTWALSSDDLTAYQVEEVNTPGAIRDDKQSLSSETLPGWVVPAGVGVLVVMLAGVVALVVRKRRPAEAAAGQDASASANGPEKMESEPAVGPATKPAVGPATEPATEPAVGPATKPAVEAESADEPAEDPAGDESHGTDGKPDA